jgi:hypothetical protein
MGTNFNKLEADEYGVIQLSLIYLLERIKSMKEDGYDFIISGSFVEMYHEEIVDLLDREKKNITIREHNGRVVLQGAKEVSVIDANSALKYNNYII